MRTATFLARRDEGEKSAFRFAHTSLQEFFLATYLLAAVRENRPGRWAMRAPSRETLDFLGQLLGEAGEPELIQTLQAWRKTYAAQTSELLLAYALRAHQCGWPVPILHGIDLRGAALRGARIAGEPGRTLVFGPASFDGADLRDATLTHLALDGARFDGAQLARANLLHCAIRGANFDGTELTATIFRKCDLRATHWREARGYRPQWLCCEPGGPDWPDGPVRQTGIAKPLRAPALPASDIGDARLAWLTSVTGHVVAWAPKQDVEGRLWLAVGGMDGSLRLWDSVSGEVGLTLTLNGEREWTFACAWAPLADAGGRLWLASAGYHGTVRLWDGASGEAGPVLRGHDGGGDACAWAPSADAGGRLWLASVGKDGTVRLWDGASGEVGPVLHGHGGEIFACAWAPSDQKGGHWLASVDGDALRLWDMTLGECVRSTSLCNGGPGGEAGHAVWDPRNNQVLEVAGDAWRYLAWLRPLPDALPERLPLETFGPVPFKGAQ